MRKKITGQKNSKGELVRILLDSGSQRTYVTENLAEKLHLQRESDEEIKIVTFGSDKPKTLKTVQTKLRMKLNNDQYIDITANIVPVISGTVQRKALTFSSSENLDHLIKSLDLADTIPLETESSQVELLVGNDYYYSSSENRSTIWLIQGYFWDGPELFCEKTSRDRLNLF